MASSGFGEGATQAQPDRINRVTQDLAGALWQHGAMIRSLALCVLILTAPAAPAAACRLALALAFDVSRSVDAADYRVQMDGIVAALFDSEIRGLILSSPDPVAMAIYEWAGPRSQRLVADWTLLPDEAAIDALAQAVLLHRRQDSGDTAVGAALAYGHALLARAPECLFQTLDVSGDGENNAGPEPSEVYAARDFSGIVVNGLAIGQHESRIRRWFAAEVARGPGAFVEFAPRHREFAAVFRRKLIRELMPPLMGALE